jgi:SAM-dependent methyltransferase
MIMKAVLEIRHQGDATTRWSKGAYEDIYGTAEIRHLDSFYQWLLDLLDVQPGRLLLDISCGVGSLPRLAAQAGLKAHGVDFSEAALRVAHRETSAVDLLVGDGERLPYPDACFDYVTHIGSLEHYVHPEAGAQELARVLKPDGCACVLLPNTFGLLGNVWTALRTGRTFDDGQPIQRYAARLEWQDLLDMAGMRVNRTVRYERTWPRSLADVRWYLAHPKDLVRLFLSPFVPLNWANYFVYLCSKATEAA